MTTVTLCGPDALLFETGMRLVLSGRVPWWKRLWRALLAAAMPTWWEERQDRGHLTVTAIDCRAGVITLGGASD